MPRVVLTPEAKMDVAQAAAWYRERSVRAAEQFLFAFGTACARIESHPTAQVIIHGGTGARRALLRKFPHRVLYLIDDDKIVIFAVMHHHRNDPAWRQRLE